MTRIIILFLFFYSACNNNPKINVCDCAQFLIDNFHTNEVWPTEKNKDVKTCEKLSKNLEFIEEMKNCENYKQFLKNEVEETYRKLINPPAGDPDVID